MFKIHFGGKRDYGKSIYAETRAPYNIKTFFFSHFIFSHMAAMKF